MTANTSLNTKAEPQALEPALSVDARGLTCPQPLLALRKALRDVAPGTLLRVQTTDPTSLRDFASFAKLSGQSLLRVEQCDGLFSFWFRSAQPHPSAHSKIGAL